MEKKGRREGKGRGGVMNNLGLDIK